MYDAIVELDGIPDRITRRLTERNNGCWSWAGAHDSNGYACVWWNGQQRSLHKVLYELLRGPVPDGKVLDHIVCDDKSCPNPWHVEPETNVANMLRSPAAPATINAAKDRCIHGHADWRPKSNGGRRCAECDRIEARNRQRRARGIPLDHPRHVHYNRRKGNDATRR